MNIDEDEVALLRRMQMKMKAQLAEAALYAATLETMLLAFTCAVIEEMPSAQTGATAIEVLEALSARGRDQHTRDAARAALEKFT